MKIFWILLVLMTFNTNAQQSKPVYVCPPCDNSCDNKTFEKHGTCDVCNMELTTVTELERVKNAKMKIAFYLQPGVEVLDFAGPMEVFAYAGYEVFTVSETKAPILSQGILKIIPDYSIKDAPPADMLAFFGGNASNAYRVKEVIDWVKAQEDIDYYFSVCTGAFVLAEAGILDGKTATTFHGALSGFKKNYPKVNVKRHVRFVDNGKVITTAGVSAGIDGALHMVTKLQGFEKAKEVAFYMEYDKWEPREGLLLTEDNPYKNK